MSERAVIYEKMIHIEDNDRDRGFPLKQVTLGKNYPKNFDRQLTVGYSMGYDNKRLPLREMLNITETRRSRPERKGGDRPLVAAATIASEG